MQINTQYVDKQASSSSRVTLVYAGILLTIPFQVLNIPRMLQFPPIQGLQIVGSFPFIVDNSVRSFLIRSQFPMSWVLGCQRNPFQDEVSYVEPPWLYHCIILPSHKVFVLGHPVFCVHPYLIYQIKVQTELLLVILILIHCHPMVGHVHFCKYDYLTSIG